MTRRLAPISAAIAPQRHAWPRTARTTKIAIENEMLNATMRRILQEFADGGSRAIEAERFEEFRESEEDRDDSGLVPFADRDRADHGDGHQKIHIRPGAPERNERLAHHGKARDDDRRKMQKELDRAARRKEMSGEREKNRERD